jgi:hypothetical protein
VEEKRGLKLDWTAEEGGKRSSIGYMSVEKWLSLHCQFVARPAPQATEQELVPQTEPKLFVEIDFIDQTQLKLYRSGAVLFAVSDMEDRFISPDLESALKELRILAGFPVDSKP